MRFQCQPGCTACCQHKGFVYLTEDDIARAARFLGMPAALFEKRYIYRTKNLRRLRIPRGGAMPVSARGWVLDSSREAHAVPHLPVLAGADGKRPQVAPDRGVVSGYR